MFSSIDRVTAEIQERFQQLQNLAQKYAFLRPEVILSMDELNLEKTPQDTIKEEFQQLECVLERGFLSREPEIPGNHKICVLFLFPGITLRSRYFPGIDGLMKRWFVWIPKRAGIVCSQCLKDF
ncbi:uncharacterized protein TNCV_3200831 [Trichonephila clavipes]|nr:uncharacterized protein TNCV_3200831 [Trichonephila clavipes]